MRQFLPSFSNLINLNEKPELVASGFGFTEGVTWVHQGEAGYLLFSDIPANVIYRWAPGEAPEVFLEKSGYKKPDVWRVGMRFDNGKNADHPGYESFTMHGSNGLALDRDGRLIIATWAGRTIERLEADGGRTILASHYDGKRFGGPNDVVVRKDGSIYFTDTFGGLLNGENDTSKELELNAIYRVRDGVVTRVIDDIPNANGLAFSPDETVLYANGSIDRYIRRYDVLPDGSVRNGRLLIDLDGEAVTGITDGMKVDALGNIWTSGPGGIWVIDPSGTPLGVVDLPEEATNLVFGGPDRRTIYISAKTSIYKIDTLVAGA